MKNLVPESLNESMASKKLNRKLKKEGGDVVKTDKAAEAIAALKKQIADVKKPGGAKTTIEKRAKVAELEAKIKAWEAKAKKKVNESEDVDDDAEVDLAGIGKALEDGDICWGSYDLEVNADSITFWTDPTDDGDYADHFEWSLDDSGDLSVVAVRRGRNGGVITGWNYEEVVRTADAMEEAYDEFHGDMNNWG